MLQVLRMPVDFLLMNKDSGNYEGVKLASGQELFSNKVIVAPSFIDTSPEDRPSVANVLDYSKDFSLGDSRHKLAKAICISNASIKPNSANCLVFFPPRSLNAEHVSSVRVLQLSSNVAVCPPGMFITYLSAPCDDNMQGKNLLQSAIDVLFYVPVSGSSANSTSDDENKNLYLKPSLLWSAFYIQELTSGADDSIFSTPMPDGDLHYNNIVDVTKKLFQKMYPGDEFSATANSFNEVDSDFGPEAEEL
ncbi:G-protein modulator [Lithospermum erythrorhizon]|uniref:G-protein modulator n=1 Tax=Lithospermum erythrorhizon TaxID=34254 RepID=A0AAV3QET9_LITER